MRSRYSAYVRGDAPYLLATWHASTRPATLDFSDAVATRWLGLVGDMRQALLKMRVEDQLRQVPVIRVIIGWAVGENHVRVRLAEQVDHHAALGFVGKNVFVHDGRPEQPRPDDVGGRLLFFISDYCEPGRRNVQIAHAAIGKDGQGDVMPGLGVERERAGAENLDVVWMSSDGEDIHGLVDRWMVGLVE